jgi:centromeric protein E
MKVLELEKNGSYEDESVNLDTFALSPSNWKSDFLLKQKEIFELWDACHVSIIHRSQFYLLFRGDPADAIYIEVELRRLTWLRNYHLKSGRKTGRDNRIASPGLRLVLEYLLYH